MVGDPNMNPFIHPDEFMVKLNVGVLFFKSGLSSRASFHFLKRSNENRAMFYAEAGKLPPASDLAEQAEEECRVERSRAKEEEREGD